MCKESINIFTTNNKTFYNFNRSGEKIMAKKIIKLLLFILLILPLTTFIVKAESLDVEAQKAFYSFFENINNGSDDVYNYIDTSNTELYNNVQSYLHSVAIMCQIADVQKEDSGYIVEARIAAEGLGWNVSGIKAKFELKKIDNEYKITDTDLFNYIGVENVFKFVIKIFAIIGAMFLGMLAIVIIIILIHKDKKKKAQDNFLETQM